MGRMLGVEMNARVAALQKDIASLSAELVDELARAGELLEDEEAGHLPEPSGAGAWLSVEDYASLRRMSRKTLYRMMEAGMPFHSLRGRGRGKRLRRRIDVAAADAWIRAAARPDPGPPPPLDSRAISVR